MPILIDQMEVQPAPAAPARGSSQGDAAPGAAPAPNEDQRRRDMIRALRVDHERRARLRAY